MGSTGVTGRGEVTLQLVICCRTREEAEGLALGEQREWRIFCGQPTWCSFRCDQPWSGASASVGALNIAMSQGSEVQRGWMVCGDYRKHGRGKEAASGVLLQH